MRALQAAERETVRLMDWTTEPPKVEGFYWAWREGNHPRITCVQPMEGMSPYVWTCGNEQPDFVEVFDYWLGPLPVPEVPKG